MLAAEPPDTIVVVFKLSNNQKASGNLYTAHPETANIVLKNY